MSNTTGDNAKQATPRAKLIADLLNSNLAKTETEWAAADEIQRLQAQIAELQSAKASAVSVPVDVYKQMYLALKEDAFNPIFTQWAVDQFLSAWGDK